MATNRRKYSRVLFACPVTIWATDGSYDTMLARTHDISMGGVCAHLHNGIAKGKKVDVQMDFLGTATPFKCSGMVVHALETDAKCHVTGIKFDALNEDKHTFLSRRLNELSAFDTPSRTKSEDDDVYIISF